MSIFNLLNRWRLLPFIVIMAYGCYPGGGGEEVEDFDLIATVYKDDYSFSPKTYFMPDSVPKIVPGDNNQNSDPVDEDYQEIILETVYENMQSLGYTRISPDDQGNFPGGDPDIAIIISVIEIPHGGLIPGHWWGKWFPGYPPTWGAYPWYPWGGYEYNYKTGTILIDMGDPNEETPDNNQMTIVWQTGINGLIDGVSIETRISRNINQAFKQSPYLSGS